MHPDILYNDWLVMFKRVKVIKIKTEEPLQTEGDRRTWYLKQTFHSRLDPFVKKILLGQKVKKHLTAV